MRRLKTTGSPEPLPGRCGARLKNTDPARYCMNHPLKGRTRCKFCGGKSRRGLEHPNWKGGRYSRAFPHGLLGRFETALDDPELFDLRRDVASLEVLIGEEMRRMSMVEGGTFDDWASSASRFTALEAAIHAGNKAAMAGQLAALKTTFEAVREIMRATRHFLTLTESRRKLVDSRTRGLAALSQVMTDAQVAVFFGALTAAIRKHVTDTKALAAIEGEFELIVTKTPVAEKVGA